MLPRIIHTRQRRNPSEPRTLHTSALVFLLPVCVITARTDYAVQPLIMLGADALELNLYFIPTDMDMTSNDIEDMQVELVAEVKSAIKIPLAVQISPFVTSIPNFVKRLVEAGADGLVLFNRFYQPDFDLDELEIVHSLDLSTSAELRLPLRWISILHGKVNTDFPLTSRYPHSQGCTQGNDVWCESCDDGFGSAS